MKFPKKCPVCNSTKLKKLAMPIVTSDDYIIFVVCSGKKCNGAGYKWGLSREDAIKYNLLGTKDERGIIAEG